eukprot:Awhi_evm1s10303
MAYEDDDILVSTIGYVCWALIIYISFESINSFFQVFKGSKTGFLQCLVLFNIFANVFSYLTTWIVVMFSFKYRFTYYMIIEFLGHVFMVNSYLWLIYNRLKVFSIKAPHRIWFWLCVLQPVVTFIDVLLFSLDMGTGILIGVFYYSGSVFFVVVIVMETAINVATIWCLVKLSRSKSNLLNSLTSNLSSASTGTAGSQTPLNSRKAKKKKDKTKFFIYHAVFTMCLQIVIDIVLVLLNFLINAFIFILIKRLAFAIKTRIMIYMFDESTKVLIGDRRGGEDNVQMKSFHVSNIDSTASASTRMTSNAVVVVDHVPNNMSFAKRDKIKESNEPRETIVKIAN